ncbi:MAG: hypothetical protein ACMG51_09340 [Ginsengibacter sp.]
MQDLLKKLKFKDAGVVLNAPTRLENEFLKAGFEKSFSKKNKSAFTLSFLKNNSELINFLQSQLNNIASDSVFWIAYPKLTGKIKSDINRDKIRSVAEEFGMRTVTAISIDDTWSALRMRPSDKVGT